MSDRNVARSDAGSREPTVDKEPRSSSPLIARSISWSVQGRLIVDGVSLTPAPGSTVGLLGPNGSGKSTLIRMLAGLRKPSVGTVLLGEEEIRAVRRRRLARRIGVVEQETGTDQDLQVRDVVDLGRIPHRSTWAGPSDADDHEVRRAAELTGVGDHLDRRYSTLSGGERQRVQLARALAQQPDVLLLDEPTNHLDVHHQLALLDLVRTAPVTSVLALHDLNLAASYCDQVLILSEGSAVAAGPPEEVFTEELIRTVYDVVARVTTDELGTHVRYLGV